MTLPDQPNTPAVELAVRTDAGRDPDKQVNEDAAAHIECTLGLLVAVKTILEVIQAATAKTQPRDALRVAIEEANRRVFGMPTSEGGYRPGSTVVAILAHAGGAEVAHVGDSRIYLAHAGAITQITKDHSMVQEMVDRNIIKAEDAAKHPDANKIMRALGIAKEVEVDVRPEPVAYVQGDVFILCSDGLSDLVSAGEILDMAGSRPAAQAAGQLVDLANARGGHDNITAMIVRMKGAATTREAATILKTMPLTAHEPVSAPADPAAGPGGTVLTAPLQSSPALPVPVAATAISAPLAHAAGHAGHAHAQPVLPVAIPSGPPPSSVRGGPSKLPIIGGIILALAVLGVAGTFLWMQNNPPHHNVPIVPSGATAPPPTDEDASIVAPEVTLAPVLAPPSGVKVPWWKDGDASSPTGENADCVRARWQKEHGRPAASYEPLEAKCRAAGGKP
jgi:serine/threonine protein phosphatase PrpC